LSYQNKTITIKNKDMITKGTEDYKRAQNLANEIKLYANTDVNNRSFFEIAFNKLSTLLDSVIKLNVFASNVAKTIDSKMNPYNRQVAFVSDKQVWVIACAAIENNIEF
jgi:hypothetical protein